MSNQAEDFKKLHAAAGNGDLEEVRALLERGVDPNRHPGMPHELSPLMRAANRGHLAVVRLLVERGANVEFTDGDGFTALTIAASHCYWEIAKVIAGAGGDVAHKDARGLSALTAAEITSDPELIAFFRNLRSDGPNEDPESRRSGET